MSSNSKSTKEQLFQSLVKYDTPYLVSTSPNNKKAFEDISSEDDKTVERLKGIFLRSENPEWEQEKLSVKDALNDPWIKGWGIINEEKENTGIQENFIIRLISDNIDRFNQYIK
jgi:hypothetical protein